VARALSAGRAAIPRSSAARRRNSTPRAGRIPPPGGAGSAARAYAASKLCHLLTARSLAVLDDVVARSIAVIAFNSSTSSVSSAVTSYGRTRRRSAQPTRARRRDPATEKGLRILGQGTAHLSCSVQAGTKRRGSRSALERERGDGAARLTLRQSVRRAEAREERGQHAKALAVHASGPPTASELATALDRLPLLAERLQDLPQPELRALIDSAQLQIVFQPETRTIGRRGRGRRRRAARPRPLRRGVGAPGRTRTCAPGSGGRRSIH
jgi:hypothetical protein